MNVTNKLPSQVLAGIKQRINAHHALYSNLVIKDKYWECILHNAFVDAGYTSHWTPESHEIGKDIVVDEIALPRISVKSGIINYSKKEKRIKSLEISGFRTTKYITIEDKLNHIDGDHEDVVYSLSSSLFVSRKVYMLTIFLPPQFKSLTWTKHKSGYKSSSLNGVSAQIVAQCSDQLWYKLDYDSPLILEKYEIVVEKG